MLFDEDVDFLSEIKEPNHGSKYLHHLNYMSSNLHQLEILHPSPPDVASYQNPTLKGTSSSISSSFARSSSSASKISFPRRISVSGSRSAFA